MPEAAETVRGPLRQNLFNYDFFSANAQFYGLALQKRSGGCYGGSQ
ncbi:hypothetical protein SynBIOSE41_01749 [Synechococcus sp. BIOS-E4-1]|nr:hypothetical protein SynBIOSE41_01749 [Synechococcus sp. BIOS-E4-1]